jgi:hypothetical protein
MDSVMERRNLLAGLMVLVISMFVLSGTALAAHKTHHKKAKTHAAETEPTEEAVCEVHSLTSFMDQGEFKAASSVADTIEVECKQVYAEKKVTIAAEELYSRCADKLNWIVPPSTTPTTGPSVEAELDDDGNAQVVAIGGPSCAAGGSLITVELNEAPYTTVTTEFTVVPPAPTEPGLKIEEPEQIENATNSSLATIVEVEFPPVFAEQYVNINDRELYNRCGEGEKLTFIGPEAEILSAHSFEAGVKTVRLDNDGNAFVVLVGAESCAAGETLVEASLENAPYTTYKGTFTVLPPQPTIK